MIIGGGDIAIVLKDREGVLFFASGVSNSGCEDVNEFEREVALLRQQDRGLHLVYFSSLCVYYSDSMYANHKRCMEEMIKGLFDSYTIVRLGNIEWGSNPHTLLNYMTKKILAGEAVEARPVYRHIVSVEEFLYWMALIPVGTRNEMNISGRFVWVPDLVKEIKTRVYD